MIELDISRTGGLIRSFYDENESWTVLISESVVSWCKDNLLHSVELTYWFDDMRQEYEFRLIFLTEEDMMLFTINYGHTWCD